jgi:hypothetical protein
VSIQGVQAKNEDAQIRAAWNLDDYDPPHAAEMQKIALEPTP